MGVAVPSRHGGRLLTQAEYRREGLWNSSLYSITVADWIAEQSCYVLWPIFVPAGYTLDVLGWGLYYGVSGAGYVAENAPTANYTGKSLISLGTRAKKSMKEY